MIFSIALFAISFLAIAVLLGRQIVKMRKLELNIEKGNRDVNRNYLIPIKRNIYHFLGLVKNFLNKYILKSSQMILGLFWGYLYNKTKKVRSYVRHSHDTQKNTEKNSDFLESLENHKEDLSKDKVDK